MFALTDYLQWQYVMGPAWLVRFLLTVNGALWRLFSVPVMLRTLFSYWRKDAVSLRQGSFGGIFKALAWNLISRGVGLFIRLMVLSAWLTAEVLFAGLALVAFAAFLFWPLLSAMLIIGGLILLGV